MKRVLKKILLRIGKLLGLESLLLLSGKQMIELHKNIPDIDSLARFEFKVFSQWGEDGIIQFLTRQIRIPNKVFVEFGVQDYLEANTRFLLVNDNWSGLVIDASKSSIDFIKKDNIFWRFDLKVICSFITKDNINQLISDNIKELDIGILSIDIDGNDYWVWQAITAITPRIVVCEYNGIFGNEHCVSVPYDIKFNRAKKHYSNLYWGASLPALCLLAEAKGYIFVGCNSNGNNAFFVRKDICPPSIGDLKKSFVMPKFRESMSRDHQRSYLSNRERIKAIDDMEIINLITNKIVLIKDILLKTQ